MSELEKRMRRSSFTPTLLALVLLPATAWANAGTPLIWASILHLLFGNALIGVFEGFLLHGVFKIPKSKTIPLLIAANYASAWVGGLLVTRYFASLADLTIENIQWSFWCFVLIAFVLTLLIELPFFRFALRNAERPWRQSMIATVAIHSISYALLLSWYWNASGTSMLTRMDVVAPESLAIPEPYALYYISRDGKQVLRANLANAGSTEVIADVEAHDQHDRLFVRPGEDSGFDLFLLQDAYDQAATRKSRILANFSERAPIDLRMRAGGSIKPSGTASNMGYTPVIAMESDWKYYTGFWAVEGIRGENQKTGEKLRYSLETPFASWRMRNATHIAGDLVVLQLGEDQICLMHPPSHRIALIARGKGPIVAEPRSAEK